MNRWSHTFRRNVPRASHLYEESIQIWVRSRAVSQPAATMRQRTIVWVREGLAGWDVLVPLRSSDSLWELRSCMLTSVTSYMMFPLTYWCFGGLMALDLRFSLVRTGVAAMGQHCN